MPFATVFGITTPISRDEWTLNSVAVGADDDRADDGTLLTSETGRKREWEGTAPVETELNREAYRRLIEGDGLHVDFDDATGFAWKGIGPKVALATFSTTGGKRGGKANVTSGQRLEYALARRMRQPGSLPWGALSGWTVAVFKKLTTADGGDDVTYVDHLATGSVVVVRGASANPAGVTQYKNGVAGNWSMGNWLNVDADGDVGIHGYSNANAAAAYDYDELLVWPFALPPTLMSTWAAQLAAFRATTSMGRLPRVLLGGDCILENTATVRGRVTKAKGEQAFLTSWAPNARRDTFTLREV